ncbi:hypothetical protein SLA2020_485430 [Shorea laevis]
MNKNWHLLMNRVEFKEKIAFVVDVFFYVLILNALHLQSPFNSARIGANPKSLKLHFLALLERWFIALSFRGSSPLHI